MAAVGTEPIRKHAAGGARADDDVIPGSRIRIGHWKRQGGDGGARRGRMLARASVAIIAHQQLPARLGTVGDGPAAACTTITGGMTFTGTLADGSTFSGVVQNSIGAGWTFLDGYGFINAQSAVAQPLP